MIRARGAIGSGLAVLLLIGCATHPPAPPPGAVAAPWDRRLLELQQANRWQLDGRTAVAYGTQGWQASLDWRQHDDTSQVHLAGPFGAGAVSLVLTPAGVSVNGAPPSADQSQALDERLGFALPLPELRYWLLGVPAPAEHFDLTRNETDRARELTQSGWSIRYDRYMPVAGDWLPALVRLERSDVRVKVAVDHWDLAK